MLMSYAKKVSIISRNCANDNVLKAFKQFVDIFPSFLCISMRSQKFNISFILQLNQVSMDNFLHINILQKSELLHQERFVCPQETCLNGNPPSGFLSPDVAHSINKWPNTSSQILLFFSKLYLLQYKHIPFFFFLINIQDKHILMLLRNHTNGSKPNNNIKGAVPIS